MCLDFTSIVKFSGVQNLNSRVYDRYRGGCTVTGAVNCRNNQNGCCALLYYDIKEVVRQIWGLWDKYLPSASQNIEIVKI